MTTPVTGTDIARVFREEHGRAVSVLIRMLGDIDVAEDAVQDAFTVAVERWPVDGMPPSGCAERRPGTRGIRRRWRFTRPTNPGRRRR